MKSRLFKAATSMLAVITFERVMFFGGITAVGMGGALHDRGLGLALAGLLALLSLKPLIGWIK